jgi:hypothetical protein
VPDFQADIIKNQWFLKIVPNGSVFSTPIFFINPRRDLQSAEMKDTSAPLIKVSVITSAAMTGNLIWKYQWIEAGT